MPQQQSVDSSTTQHSPPPKLTVSQTPLAFVSKYVVEKSEERRRVNDEDKLHTPSTASEVEPCPWEESLEGLRLEHHLKSVEPVFTQESTEEEVVAAEDAIVATTETTAAKESSFLRYYFKCYYELWKTRLSSLVVFTTMGGYYASGGEFTNWKSSLALVGGTFLQAACANTMNELFEVERDRIMTRTQNRPLPTKRISKLHAFIQGALAGIGGTYVLYKYTNPLTAALGAANILLYAAVYTPMKVIHWSNTWIGTLNGSLPPLMGCAAVKNEIMDATGLFMFSSMYLWQISHFMAICYKCKFDYNRAGYKMLSISNPKQAAIQSVVHSALLFPLCWALPYYGVLPWWFAVVSTPINYYLLMKPSLKFMKDVNYENATALFFRSLGHLPALFFTSVFAFCWQNRGLKTWTGNVVEKVYNWITGR